MVLYCGIEIPVDQAVSQLCKTQPSDLELCLKLVKTGVCGSATSYRVEEEESWSMPSFCLGDVNVLGVAQLQL